MFFGDNQARLMETQQPMKMAAAEAIYNTQSGASFSLLTIGNLSGDPIFQIRLPHMLSVLADNSWSGSVQGINQIQAKESATYGPGNYKPILWVTYWTFRIMVGCGILMLVVLATGLWLMYRRKLESSKWFLRLAVPAIALPFVANATGWIFTEMGRQPWVVYGLLKTSQAVSDVGTGYVVTTLIGFTAIYSLLAIIDFGLMARYARRDPDATDEHDEHDHDDHNELEPGEDRVRALVY
jgi:cytochrome d ubiquinol oxidase subunit I